MDIKKLNYDLALEAIVQTFPYVGGPLATIYFGHKQEKRFQRIENFYKEIKKEIEQLNNIIPSISLHDEDELGAIIEELNEKIETEHLEIKRRFYKHYFISTLMDPVKTKNYDERKLFLNILAALSPMQLELIIYLAKLNQPILTNSMTKPGVSQALIAGAIAQIKLYGIVDSVLESIGFSWSGGAINETIILNELGKDFHNFCLS